MRSEFAWSIASLLIFGASPCWAAPQTTQRLLVECRDAQVLNHEQAPSDYTDDRGVNGLACLNYLYGIVGGHRATLEMSGGRSLLCFPPNMSTHQLAAVYVNWGDRNPEKWHLKPWSTVMMALQEAFPCQ